MARRPTRPRGGLQVKDAFRMAAENERFAQDLTKTPEKYKEVFSLSDAHIAALKKIKVEDYADLRMVVTPESFAETIAATEKLLRKSPQILGVGAVSAKVYD